MVEDDSTLQEYAWLSSRFWLAGGAKLATFGGERVDCFSPEDRRFLDDHGLPYSGIGEGQGFVAESEVGLKQRLSLQGQERDVTLVKRAGLSGAYYLFLEPPRGVHYHGSWGYRPDQTGALALLKCASSLARFVMMTAVVAKTHDEIWLPGGTERHGSEWAALQRAMCLRELQRIDRWPFDRWPNYWSEKVATLEWPSL